MTSGSQNSSNQCQEEDEITTQKRGKCVSIEKIQNIILFNVFQTRRVTCKVIPTDPTPLYERMEEVLFHMPHTNTCFSNSKKGQI